MTDFAVSPPPPPTNTGQQVAGIIGWIVYTTDINRAALYNLSEREKAFSAASRWGASIQALTLHPESPAQ